MDLFFIILTITLSNIQIFWLNLKQKIVKISVYKLFKTLLKDISYQQNYTHDTMKKMIIFDKKWAKLPFFSYYFGHNFVESLNFFIEFEVKDS